MFFIFFSISSYIFIIFLNNSNILILKIIFLKNNYYHPLAHDIKQISKACERLILKRRCRFHIQVIVLAINIERNVKPNGIVTLLCIYIQHKRRESIFEFLFIKRRINKIKLVNGLKQTTNLLN